MTNDLLERERGKLANQNQTHAEPKPSATVVLVRDCPSRDGVQVFLLERTSSSDFPGAFVVPGGKIDIEDHSESIARITVGLTVKEASEILGLESGGLAYWIACMRECFEEAGLLIAYRPSSVVFQPSDEAEKERFTSYRKRLNSGQHILEEMCTTENIDLAADRLAYLSHWITPTSQKKRYTTRFFIAQAPDGQDTVHDGSEIISSLWIRPEEALRKQADGKLLMILPTRMSLQQICGYRSAAELFDAKKIIDPSSIRSIEPKFFQRNSKRMGLLPDDADDDEH